MRRPTMPVVVAALLAATFLIMAPAASAHVVRITKARLDASEAMISIKTRKLVVPISYDIACPGAKGMQISLGLLLPSGGIKGLPPIRTAGNGSFKGQGTVVLGSAKRGVYQYLASIRCWDPASGGPGHGDETVGGGSEPWSRAHTQHVAVTLVRGKLRVP